MPIFGALVDQIVDQGTTSTYDITSCITDPGDNPQITAINPALSFITFAGLAITFGSNSVPGTYALQVDVTDVAIQTVSQTFNLQVNAYIPPINNPIKTASLGPYFTETIPNVAVKLGSIAIAEVPEIANPEGFPYSLSFSLNSDDISGLC